MVKLVGDGRNTVKEYTYDAFGNEASPVSTDANSFRYGGQYYDKDTGLYYLRARYYDPVIGRFTQQDPHWNTGNMIYGDDPVELTSGLYAPSIAAIVQSGNRYPYAMNNPVKYVDPDGESILAALTGIGAALKTAAEVALVTSVVDGTLTGIAYALNGDDYNSGFVNGAASGLITGALSGGGPGGILIGSGIASIAGQKAEDLFEGNIVNYATEDYIAMAIEGSFYNLPTASWHAAKSSVMELSPAIYDLFEFDETFETMADALVRVFEKLSIFASVEG